MSQTPNVKVQTEHGRAGGGGEHVWMKPENLRLKFYTLNLLTPTPSHHTPWGSNWVVLSQTKSPTHPSLMRLSSNKILHSVPHGRGGGEESTSACHLYPPAVKSMVSLNIFNCWDWLTSFSSIMSSNCKRCSYQRRWPEFADCLQQRVSGRHAKMALCGCVIIW